MIHIKWNIVIALLFQVTLLNAQKGSNHVKMGMGVNVDLRNAINYNAGLNVLVSDYIGVKENASIVLTAGYNSFSYKTNTSFKASYLLATLGYRVFAKSNFYFQPYAGASLTVGDFNKGKNGIAYGIGLGNVFAKKNRTGLDAMVRVEGNSNAWTWVGLTLGYQFKIK
jgi:hypothetical protein